MNEQTPIRVSTIIPVYNGEDTIARAIDSALAQDFASQEIIVVNDGSTDNTAEVLAGYGDRIRVIHQMNGGAAHARNAGITVAGGEYLAFLDADDEWLTGHLPRSAGTLDSDAGAALCFGSFVPVERGRDLPPLTTLEAPSLNDLLNGYSGGILPSTVLARRSAITACGGFPTEFRGAGFEDTYLWLLLAEQGRFHFISEPLVRYTALPLSEAWRKYEPKFETFCRLVTQRYGAAAKPLLAVTRNNICASLLFGAIESIDAGAPREAIASLWRLFRLDPAYVFRHAGLRRLLQARNWRRGCALVTDAPRNILRSGSRGTSNPRVGSANSQARCGRINKL